MLIRDTASRRPSMMIDENPSMPGRVQPHQGVIMSNAFHEVSFEMPLELVGRKKANVSVMAQLAIFNDLLESSAGLCLPARDLNEAFSNTFHGKSWRELIVDPVAMGGQGEDYYATDSAVKNMTSQAQTLLTVLAGLGYGMDMALALRVVSMMPMRRYYIARSMPGAYLASLIAGKPSWRLNTNAVGDQVKPYFHVYYRGSDTPLFPVAFSSDPVTNEEALVVQKVGGSDDTLAIAIEDVVFKPSSYSSAYFEGDAVEISHELAAHWLTHGQSLQLYSSHAERSQTLHGAKTMTHTFALSQIKRSLATDPFLSYTLIPVGLETVRDPAKRWNPDMAYSRAYLPLIQQAQEAYQQVIEKHPGCESPESIAARKSATVRFNQMLQDGLVAFWSDTRELNDYHSLAKVFLSSDPEQTLHFSSTNPVDVFKKIAFGDNAWG